MAASRTTARKPAAPPKPRVVVITFDAATSTFAINPNPISIPGGLTTLYFALQTANRGCAEIAELLAIFEDKLIKSAEAVDGCDQLWKVEIDNEGKHEKLASYGYTVRVRYAGKEFVKDPTVILEPPNIEPPDGPDGQTRD